MKLVSHERSEKGKARDDWETPPALFRYLDEIYRFNLDVAATAETAKCNDYLGPDRGVETRRDGLSCPWAGKRVWCNPPYSNWAAWVEKAAEERNQAELIIMLLPPRVETAAFHNTILKSCDEIVLFQTRVPFYLDGVPRPQNGAPSSLLIWHPRIRGAQYGPPRLISWYWKAGGIETRPGLYKTIYSLIQEDIQEAKQNG